MEENERDGMSRVEFLYVRRVHAAKWDTYVCICTCCISSLWQPLTYFLLCVLPYNSGANITTYGRKSKRGKGWPGRRNAGKGREENGNRNGE